MSSFEVIFLDVGQGDCTLIALPNGKYMLIDIYRSYGKGSVDVFKLLRDVLPDGEDGGKQRLDYLVITHAHDDHIWGIGDLAEEFEIGELWVPQYGTKKELSKNYEAFEKVVEDQPEDTKIWQKGSRTPVAELGDDGEISVRCVSPPGYVEVEETLDEDAVRKVVHENCGVYRFTYDGVSVMFAGDSNLSAWERILGYYEDEVDEQGLEVLASQILHASHHGSRTFVKDSKDDEAWLDALEAIDPQEIVISVGESNQHEHPHADMLEIYDENAGSEHVLETMETGTLVLSVTGERSFELKADESYAERYGWDEDADARAGGPSGRSGKAARIPRVPAPGFEKVPQAAPRRERYG